MQTYTGACHCERVRFRVLGDLADATLCNCSICTKKGILHLIVEASQFELTSGAEELVSYRFNTGVAEHKFCRHCGIHAFYTPRSDPDKVDVNIRCLDGVDLSKLELQLFDGKHWEEAIRTAHWQRDHEASLFDTPGLRVRAINQQETALLRDLRLAALRDAPDQLGESLTDAAARSDAAWAALVASVTPPSAHAAYVADLDGEPIGMVYALSDQSDESIGRLGGMWVAPTARRRGVGTALVDAVVAWSRANGKRCVRLGVVPGGPAERLYRRSGFIATGASKLFPGSESRQVIEMQLKLEWRD